MNTEKMHPDLVKMWEDYFDKCFALFAKSHEKVFEQIQKEQDEPVALKPCGYASAEKKMCRKCGQVHAEAIFDTTPQPKQEQGEPVGEMVAWPSDFERVGVNWISYVPDVGTKLYTTPRPKQEQGELVGTLAVFDDAESDLGWSYDISANLEQHKKLSKLNGANLYTTPYVPTGRQQRTAAEGEDTRRAWVGLTEEEVIDLWPDLIMHRHTYQFWQNVEAKLKEKNG